MNKNIYKSGHKLNLLFCEQCKILLLEASIVHTLKMGYFTEKCDKSGVYCILYTFKWEFKKQVILCVLIW